MGKYFPTGHCHVQPRPSTSSDIDSSWCRRPATEPDKLVCRDCGPTIGTTNRVTRLLRGNKIAAARGTYINILQAGRGTLRITLTFGYHIGRYVFIDSGRYPAGAVHRFQGPADYTDGHTHFNRTIIIDVHMHLGFSFLKLSVNVDQAGIIRFDLLQEDVPPLGQLPIGADADDELPRFFNSLPEPLRTGGAPPVSLPRPGVVGSSR
jgi:hypothetical protein